jgi:ABC-2 type transport system ATP-binding protein
MTSGSVIVADHHVSKWYGQVLGVSEVTWRVGTGIVGLLGPNGAGKSTLMKLMVGLLRPSRGNLTVFGGAPWAAGEARRRIGYCPEHDGVYDELSALEFVTVMVELTGCARGAAARERAARALDEVGLAAAMNRRLGGFSKGMRQRTKLAQAFAHDPEVLLFDEPLTGVDPLARTQVIDRIRALGAAGKTVIVSSHVLYEIEALTEEILVIYRGQVLAEGNTYRIRELIDRHPHRIEVACDRPRDLGARLAAAEHVARLRFADGGLTIETRDPDRCYDLIADQVLAGGIQVSAMTSPDNNLGAVFDYLTRGSGGE